MSLLPVDKTSTVKQAPSRVKLNVLQVESIDGLRAVAVLMVVLQHYKSAFAGAHGPLAAFTTPGVVGVVLFFVISGLCITLSKTENVTWGQFYLRRAFRLAPALWVGMALVFAANHFFLGKAFSVQDIIGTLAILPQNFGNLLSLNPPLWSLQTEAGLYLIFPVTLYLFFRLTQKQFLTVSIIVSVVAYGFWLAHFHGFTYYPPFPALCHVIVWNLGLLLAYDRFHAPSEKTKSLLLSAVVLLLAGTLLLLLRNYSRSNSFACWYFVSGYGCYLLTKWALVSTPQVLRTSIMRKIGQRSYSLYLLHLPVAYICVALIHFKFAAFIITLAITGALVELLYQYVEKPCIILGKRLTKTSRAPDTHQVQRANEQASV